MQKKMEKTLKTIDILCQIKSPIEYNLFFLKYSIKFLNS
jgi:hypothetical protein